MPRKKPYKCPSCGGDLLVTELTCASCKTTVRGRFPSCPFCRLEGELRELFELFLLSRGNLKEMQRLMGVSYPTVRLRVESMFEALGYGAKKLDRLEVLRLLRTGELSVEEAEKLLK